MVRWIVRVVLGAAVLLVMGVSFARYKVETQGSEPIEAVGDRAGSVSVTVDDRGIPTIRGRTWEDVLEAEGYHVASQRFFQMELMRRAASGRLAALFGEKAVPVDKRRLEEDWPGVAARAYADLPADERAALDAYTAGVNRFLREKTNAWGIELELLRLTPEPWRGEDSMAILLTMAEELTSSAPSEVMEGKWRSAVRDREWLDFLFTPHHPWNVPLFGGPGGTTKLPSKRLPAEPLAPREGLAANAPTPTEESDVEGTLNGTVSGALRELVPMGLPPEDGPTPASNSWAYCGTSGCWLANDPHLGYGVPELWFAVRLEVTGDLAQPPLPAGDAWAVGVAIPGLPGLVLGMNAHLAWAFTNTGEDVDDLLAETVSPDRKSYLARPGEWAPLMVRTATIHVKDGAPVHVRVEATHRGPLLSRPGVIEDHSRQWLPLKPGMLRLPIGIPRARTLDELDRVLDGMKAPAQNVTAIDRHGNISYRTSGTGIARRAPGRVPAPAMDGEWLGYLDPSTRPRLRISATSTSPRMLVTANQRIWVDDGAHAWADDARDERIRRALSASDRLSGDDMRALQLDTDSRYHQWLLRWVEANAAHAPPLAWRAWDGHAAHDQRTFTEALEIDRALQSILVGRVRKHLAGGADLPYTHRLARAWVIATLESPESTRLFGIEPEPLANRLVAAAASAGDDYARVNRWETQHPFVGRVPDLIGQWFAISTPVQVGHRALVRTEAPTFGASVRMVWNAGDPTQSRWSFPVGQSGHIGSPHYDDAREDWFAGRFRPVFVPTSP